MADVNHTILPKNVKDAVGLVSGKLTAVAFSHTNKTRSFWHCKCECGGSRIVSKCDLKTENIKSCGCAYQSHGESRKGKNTKEYSCWHNIHTRCFNEKFNRADRYSNRGITMCSRWRFSFAEFLADVGRAPSNKHTIDRIDNNGNYSCGKCDECIARGWPANVRWATRSQQNLNKCNNKLLEIDGVVKTVTEWSETSPVGAMVIFWRLYRGWPAKKAVYVPLGSKRHRKIDLAQ